MTDIANGSSERPRVLAAVAVYSPTGALTDKSSTIATGGTLQPLFAASTTAIHRSVENPVSATETLSVQIGSTVYELMPGGYIERNQADFMPTDAWQIKAATTGHAFIAGEA